MRVIRVRDGREETGDRASGREGRGTTETWSTGQNMDLFYFFYRLENCK